jgi:hypothetical protein
MKITVTPHHPYSPDLTPCDFVLFPKMKLNLRGRCFESIEETQTELQDVMKMLTQNDFQHGNTARITVLMQKGTTSKEKELNTNF